MMRKFKYRRTALKLGQDAKLALVTTGMVCYATSPRLFLMAFGGFVTGAVVGAGSPIIIPSYTIYKAYENYTQNVDILRKQEFIDLSTLG